jgi:NAD(P)-dependent dehydrogenase (short-subunit alcohol dehydrogenase family)
MSGQMVADFDGKVAFVTGATSGIGRETALAFARAGANVVAADIQEEGSRETAAMIEDLGQKALAVTCDVTRSDDVRDALDQTIKTFGRLDFAFNNAGIEQPVIPTTEITEELFDRIVTVNLRGVFLCMKHEIPLMLEHGGSIVNTSSAAGLVGCPGQAAYTAAKHGVVGLTKGAALDYANTGLRVNAVCPGVTDTPMIKRVSEGTAEGEARLIAQQPIGRMGRPEEIAAAVVWLSSDAASFVVGHALAVDGGMVVW